MQMIPTGKYDHARLVALDETANPSLPFWFALYVECICILGVRRAEHSSPCRFDSIPYQPSRINGDRSFDRFE